MWKSGSGVAVRRTGQDTGGGRVAISTSVIEGGGVTITGTWALVVAQPSIKGDVLGRTAGEVAGTTSAGAHVPGSSLSPAAGNCAGTENIESSSGRPNVGEEAAGEVGEALGDIASTPCCDVGDAVADVATMLFSQLSASADGRFGTVDRSASLTSNGGVVAMSALASRGRRGN